MDVMNQRLSERFPQRLRLELDGGQSEASEAGESALDGRSSGNGSSSSMSAEFSEFSAAGFAMPALLDMDSSRWARRLEDAYPVV